LVWGEDDLVMKVNKRLGLASDGGIQRCFGFKIRFVQNFRKHCTKIVLHLLDDLIASCLDRVVGGHF